jgi:hypothetical protein
MAKRVSEIQRIQTYFEDAPLEAANVILEIATGIVKRRNGISTPVAPRKQRSDKGTKRQDALPLNEATA